jgi:hypothetical protein
MTEQDVRGCGGWRKAEEEECGVRWKQMAEFTKEKSCVAWGWTPRTETCVARRQNHRVARTEAGLQDCRTARLNTCR